LMVKTKQWLAREERHPYAVHRYTVKGALNHMGLVTLGIFYLSCMSCSLCL
jgi:hypothetical protein